MGVGKGKFSLEGTFPWVEDFQAQDGLCVRLGQILHHFLPSPRRNEAKAPHPLQDPFIDILAPNLIFSPIQGDFLAFSLIPPTVAVCLPAGSSIKGKGDLYSLKDY